jgi:hypothetical protein
MTVCVHYAAVTDRTQQMGVRLARGAPRGDLLRQVLREGLVPVLCGVLARVALSVASAQPVEGLLYGVRPGDPATVA